MQCNFTPYCALQKRICDFQSCKPQGQALALGGLKASIEGLGLVDSGLGLVGLSLGLGLVAQALALNDFHILLSLLL